MKKFFIAFFIVGAIILTDVVVHYAHNHEDSFLLDFSTIDGDTLTRSELKEDGYVATDWDNNLEDHTSIVEIAGNKVLEVFYPEGQSGTKGTGTQFELDLNPGREYYMSYDFMFDENFSFGSEYQGGKLPGITAGKRCSGVCDGTDGFAARFMWRRDGLAELYLCNVDKKSDYCDDIYFKHSDGSKVYFERGVKYTIEEYVRLNSGPNNYDGQIVITLNGEEVLNLEGIRLVTDDDLIDTFYFSTFHGGSGAKWVTSNDSYMYYDNIYVEKLS